MLDLIPLVSILQANGYLIMLLLMIIEGPIVTFAASFLSSLGFFNIYIIFVLSVLGNSIPDKIIYFIGRFSRGPSLEKFLSYFGLNKKRIILLEKHLKNHLGKTIIFTKLAPGLAIPGILITGFTKSDFKKFFILSTTFDILASIIFILTGYFSGMFTENALRYFKLEAVIIPVILIGIIIFFYLYKWVYRKLSVYFK